MAFKFRRTIKIAPGLRLNLTHRGVSARVGGRGLGYTVNANGRQHISAGIPGSGIHLSEQIAPARKSRPTAPGAPRLEAPEPQRPDDGGSNGGAGRIVAWIIVGLIVLLIGFGIAQTALNDGLAQAAGIAFGLTLIGSLPWLVLSLLRMVPKRTRASGKRQAGYALIGTVVSFFAVIALGVSQAPNPSTSPQSVAEAELNDEPPAEIVVADLDEEDAFEIALADTAPIPTARPAKVVPAQATRRELLPTEEARVLCRAIDQSGLGSAPCDYSGWNQTITMTIDMHASEARSFCQQMVTYSRQNSMNLAGWRLEIRSPYSGSSSIAFCQLS